MVDSHESIDLALLANFVHQVINPLTGVSGTLDNLAEGVIKEQHRREQRLRAARAQLEATIALIRNLALFAQLSEDPSGLATTGQLKTCVIPQTIIEAAMFFQEQGADKKINIDLTDKKTQIKIRADPDLLKQVFMNLFDNGVKYGQPGWPIKVSPRLRRKTNDVLIEISGKSVGFGSSETGKIFELGFRGSGARELIASGTGLGLFICKKIVEDVYGGRMWASSSKSSGMTKFFVSLPNGFV